MSNPSSTHIRKQDGVIQSSILAFLRTPTREYKRPSAVSVVMDIHTAAMAIAVSLWFGGLTNWGTALGGGGRAGPPRMLPTVVGGRFDISGVDDMLQALRPLSVGDGNPDKGVCQCKMMKLGENKRAIHRCAEKLWGMVHI